MGPNRVRVWDCDTTPAARAVALEMKCVVVQIFVPGASIVPRCNRDSSDGARVGGAMTTSASRDVRRESRGAIFLRDACRDEGAHGDGAEAFADGARRPRKAHAVESIEPTSLSSRGSSRVLDGHDLRGKLAPTFGPSIPRQSCARHWTPSAPRQRQRHSSGDADRPVGSGGG